MIARRVAEITTELAQAETQTNRDPLVALKTKRTRFKSYGSSKKNNAGH